MFLIGLAADLLGRFTVLPRVTLLLLGGLAIGPAGFSLLPESFLHDWFPVLTNIALALKKRGARVVRISICKVIGAWLAVGLVLLATGTNPVVAVLLAGIAPATAPAATYDVVHESGATGEFPETVLSIVAIDDVWGLILFALMAALAGTLIGDAPVSGAIVGGFTEIGGGIALGLAFGVPMAYLTGRIRRGEPMLAEGMGFVLLGAGAAEWINVSPILTAMTMGATVASLARHHDRPFHAIEGVEWPFMILFFVLAGASLEIEALRHAGGLTIVYILCRCTGIYVGARFGGRLAGVSPGYQKWLGAALFPQAGVAIGMALLASQRFPEITSLVLPVVLTSAIFFELFAPVITRKALRAVGAFDAPGDRS
jgi:Kef-type K+ transport system membrane component KefB